MMIDKTIVALDQMNELEIDQFLIKLGPQIGTIKIGLELFLRYGPDYVKSLHAKFKKDIFLDLKLHDIPVTVEKAILSLEGLPLKFLTIHLSGGLEMIKSSVKQAKVSLPNCNILGVSFLTSLENDDLKSIFGIEDNQLAFQRMFQLAHEGEIHGVVCSPHEIKLLKEKYPAILAVTPGIRFEDELLSSLVQDQKRTASPAKAFENGADYIVMGRSLTKSKDLNTRLQILSR